MLRDGVLPTILAIVVLLAVCTSQPLEVVMIEYGESLCPACVEQKKVLEQLQSEGVVRFVYVELMWNQTNVQEYVSLYEHLNLYSTEGGYLVPLLVIVVEGGVRGAAVGAWNASQLKQMIAQASSSTSVKVWSSKKVFELSNATAIAIVQTIIERRLVGAAATLSASEVSTAEVLAVLIPLAAADSANPCTFAVYTALLMVILVLAGVRKAAASSAAFILAVFVCYYLLGVGLVIVAAALPSIILKVVAALGLAAGLYSITVNLKGGFKSPVPAKLKQITENALNKVTGPLGAAGLGALCSFTLLPCSSGPYIVFAGVLSRLQSPLIKYTLLALYNAIFVSPLAAIATAVCIFGVKARSLKKLRSERALTIMELTASSLLVAVCIWLLTTY